MDLAEVLYWYTVADLSQDDYGIWEIAWHANVLNGAASDDALEAAAQVIRRLVTEQLVTVKDDAGADVSLSLLDQVLAGSTWARTEFPTPMLHLHGLDALDARNQEMPQEAIDAITAAVEQGH